MSFIAILVAILAAVLALLVYVENQAPENLSVADSMAESSGDNLESFQAKNQSCFILGYTGEVGKVLLQQILEKKVFSRVVLFGRRNIEFEGDLHKNVEQHVVDFEDLDKSKDLFSGIDQGFCCLGTTRGKAGKAGFIKVDHDYVVNSAKVAHEQGCEHFHLVSSQGANANSSFLYPKTKGQVEAELAEMKFGRLSIYRPAVLLCDRQESRPGEAIARFLIKPIAAAFPTVISTPVTSLVQAIINCAASPNTEENKSQIYDNKAIHSMAKTTSSSSKSSE